MYPKQANINATLPEPCRPGAVIGAERRKGRISLYILVHTGQTKYIFVTREPTKQEGAQQGEPPKRK